MRVEAAVSKRWISYARKVTRILLSSLLYYSPHHPSIALAKIYQICRIRFAASPKAPEKMAQRIPDLAFHFTFLFAACITQHHDKEWYLLWR
jgi:hypothetical protein